MGMAAALKRRQILANAAAILSIALLAACQALDCLAPLKSGRLAERARVLVRQAVIQASGDRPLHGDIARVAEMVSRGDFAKILA